MDSESRQRLTPYDETYLANIASNTSESIEMDDFARTRERHVSEDSDTMDY